MDTTGKLVVGLFAALLVGIVTFLVIRETYTFRRGQSLLSPQQYRFRMIGAAILYLVVVMMCAGVYVIDFTGLPLFATYWTAFGVLTVVPVIMSLVDLRRLARVRVEKQRKLRKEMAAFVHEQAEMLRSSKGSSTPDLEDSRRG